MKQCPTCHEEFADRFTFCPVDGTPLPGEFHQATVESAYSSFATSNGNGAGDKVKATPHAASVVTEDSAQQAHATDGAAQNYQANGNGAHASYANGNGANNAASNGDGAHAGTNDAVDDATDAGATVGADAVNNAVVKRGEYHITMIEDTGLIKRLSDEISQVRRDSQLTFPEFKRDPVGFTRRAASASAKSVRKSMTPQAIMAIIGAIMLIPVMLLIIGALALASANIDRKDQSASNDPEVQLMDIIPTEQPKPKEEGAAGAAEGKGGGSKPKQEKPAGGGGGGRQEQKPASAGKLPPASLTIPQVVAPNPRPPVRTPSLPTPSTIVADPVLFPPDPRAIPYGDPKSKSTEVSSGPGTNGGIGTGDGAGVGSGERGGVGPGRNGGTGGGDRRDGGGGPGGGGDGVDYNRTFRPAEVSRRAQINSKPQPGYTDEARKNQVSGTVRLRAVLNSNGTVTGISAVQRLPDGLTEKAIAAARGISFTPAQKDGHPVSQYVTLEYSFTLY